MKHIRSLLLCAACALGMAAQAFAASWDEAAAGLRAAALAEGETTTLLAQARTRGVQPAQVVAWAQRLQALARAGVPPTLASERLMQGLTKGVAVERLDQGLHRLESDLFWLHGVIGQRVARAEMRAQPAGLAAALRHGEASLRAGLARTELERVLGPGPLTLEQVAALARTAGALRGAGIEAAAIERALAGLGAGGLRGEALERLEERFAAALARGTALPEAFAEFEDGLRQLEPEPATDRAEALRREELRREMRESLRAPAAGPDLRPGAPGGVGPGIGGRPGR